MRAVVFGYSNVGDRCLRVLRARGVDVVLVATHRDHPGETLWFRRVADTADELGLPWMYADDPKSPELEAAVRRAQPDLLFSFYYRAMLPPAVLALARHGAYNLHGSLLPQFRGRAPTNWAVLMAPPRPAPRCTRWWPSPMPAPSSTSRPCPSCPTTRPRRCSTR